MVGYVSIEDFSLKAPVYFLKSTDGGFSWEPKVFLNTWRDEQGIGFVTENLGWIGGFGGETYETTDGGTTWTVGGPGMYVNRFRFLGDSLGYAAGDRVYKYSYEEPTSVSFPDVVVPQYVALSQNYPNPFNPSTTIAYDLPASAHVTLSVYDVLGNEVEVLVNESQRPGSYRVRFAPSTLASGVYFYRLSVLPLAGRDLVSLGDGTAGEFVQTRKLLLLR
jgi:hypothetical protein